MLSLLMPNGVAQRDCRVQNITLYLSRTGNVQEGWQDFMLEQSPQFGTLLLVGASFSKILSGLASLD